MTSIRLPTRAQARSSIVSSSFLASASAGFQSLRCFNAGRSIVVSCPRLATRRAYIRRRSYRQPLAAIFGGNQAEFEIVRSDHP